MQMTEEERAAAENNYKKREEKADKLAEEYLSAARAIGDGLHEIAVAINRLAASQEDGEPMQGLDSLFTDKHPQL